jgi:hypothetical protein
MNTYKTRVAARFAPETRFEVKPAAPAPFRALQETEFERLRAELLGKQLAVAAPELNVPLRRAANEAAAVAWATVIPLLAFPVLFEEKAQTAVAQAKRQARILAETRELLAA